MKKVRTIALVLIALFIGLGLLKVMTFITAIGLGILVLGAARLYIEFEDDIREAFADGEVEQEAKTEEEKSWTTTEPTKRKKRK